MDKEPASFRHDTDFDQQWRVDKIRTLSKTCDCMSHYARDALLFAVDDTLNRIRKEIRTVMSKQPGSDPEESEKLNRLSVESRMYNALADELRNNVKLCDAKISRRH